jgi:probable HAF family extracellular repeat protein
MANLGDTVNDYGDGYWSNATGINDRGHVVGTAAGGYHYAVAFLYKKGLMTEVPPLPGSYINGPNTIIRVNLKDHVAGTSYRNVDDAHLAWMSKDGATVQLAPDSDRSEAYAVNDKDQVAGFMRVGTPLTHNDWPVIWKNGSAKLLNTLAGFDDHGQANAINNLGWAVGSACNKVTCTPFGFNGYKMFDLNTRLSGASTGWVLIEATAINDAGVIAGTGSFAGEVHAIMATPVTAPGTP